ncbi:MAG: cytochrome c3 family protein [Longimicrobiales bacterium]
MGGETMRRKLPLLFGAVFLAFAAGACEGPQGPEGPIGPEGPEGPQGPPGEDGQDGTNALNTCSDCHTSNATIVAVEQQFELSPHGFGNFEVRGPAYAGGACVACHTSQGFVANATDGTADYSDGAASMNCGTCHQIHSTFEGEDYALTTTDPVTLIVTGNEIDVSGTGVPGSNLCASCHQGRDESPYPAWDADVATTYTVGPHYGIHYGTQANMYQGELPTEILYGLDQGTTYSPHEGASCLGCHMGLGDDVNDIGLDGVTPGGDLFHNFTPAEAVCDDCHGATDGFDHGTVRTEVQTAVTALAQCLEAEGVATIHLDADGVLDEFHEVEGDHPEPYVAAWLVTAATFNDGSWGAHNPGFTQTLVDAARTEMDANSAEAACDYTP